MNHVNISDYLYLSPKSSEWKNRSVIDTPESCTFEQWLNSSTCTFKFDRFSTLLFGDSRYDDAVVRFGSWRCPAIGDPNLEEKVLGGLEHSPITENYGGLPGLTLAIAGTLSHLLQSPTFCETNYDCSENSSTRCLDWSKTKLWKDIFAYNNRDPIGQVLFGVVNGNEV